MTGQGPLGKLQGFYGIRTFSEPCPTGPSGRGLHLGPGVNILWNLWRSQLGKDWPKAAAAGPIQLWSGSLGLDSGRGGNRGS